MPRNGQKRTLVIGSLGPKFRIDPLFNVVFSVMLSQIHWQLPRSKSELGLVLHANRQPRF
jgi:hypothetical protein